MRIKQAILTINDISNILGPSDDEVVDEFWSILETTDKVIDHEQLQSVVNSLEGYKRRLGRQVTKCKSIMQELDVRAKYNRTEDNIAYLVKVFGLNRSSKPHKLKNL